MPPIANLLQPLPNDLTDEVFTELLRQGAVRIERIVSNGHVSPADFWYDQDENEWVLLLVGEGEIEFADGERVRLRQGDTLNLPAHTRHRVTFTSRPAVWLAVFYPDLREKPRPLGRGWSARRS
ncbi:MAG: cupin domain-containing protein [Candidatus Competibacteraceae bacterium]|nr:cupin domain-containing protein [Candidatus Competibacteraceae bacterium]